MTLTINDVRAKFPDYGDLSDEQLAEALHKKYYADMPQTDFYSAIGLERMDIKESPRPKPRPAGNGPSVSTDAPAFGSMPADPAIEALAKAMGADAPPVIGAPPRLAADPDAPPVSAPDVLATAFGAGRQEDFPPSKAPDFRSLMDEGVEAALANGGNLAPAVVAPDPFSGEVALSLLKRRGQQFVKGATEVVASVPESLAIMGAAADAGRAQGAGAALDQRAATIADIKAQLADPSLAPAAKAFLERNLAELEVGQGVITGMANEPILPAAERSIFKGGDTVRKASKETFGEPDARDTGFWASIAEGGGNMAGMIAASAAGTLAGGPAGGLMVGGASGATMNQSQVYKEALQSGADEATAMDAAKWATLIGASEIIPINRALKILPPRLRGELTTGVMRKFVDLAQGAGEEAAQEYLATVANNIVAQKLYDPERGWTEGATDAALVGAVLGAGVAAGGLALEGRGDAAPPASAPPRVKQAPIKTPEDDLAELMGAKPADALTAPATPPAEPQASSPTGEANFRVMDEVENNADGKSVPTGRKVRVDLTTGQATVVGAEETPAQAGGAPVASQSDGQQPQVPSAPVVGNDAPPAAGRTPEEELAAAMGPTSETAAPPSPEVAPSKAPARNQPSNVEFLDQNDVQNVQTDAATFQYKAGGDQDGVTDRLRGVTKWDTARAGMAVIYEKADGSRYIADGHQRLGLAKRLSSEGKPVQMTAIILRETDGVTPQEARAQAALKNIAEGSGTATDAAKVLRDSNATPQELGLPPNSAIVRDAMGMRNLSDQAFGMIVNGIATEAEGGLVGRVVKDPALHADILGLLKRLKPSNAFQAEAIVRQAIEATSTETQTSLFGDEDVQTNLYLERAKILDGAFKRVRDDLKTFKTLVDRAETVSGAGNVLNADANAQRLATDTAVRDYMSSQANMKGPISDALTAAARAYRADKRIGTAIDAFVRAVEGTMDQGGSGSAGGDPAGQALRPDGAGSADQGSQGQPDQVVTPEPAPAPESDLFAPAQTGKTPEQIRAEAEAEVRKNQSKIRKVGGNDGDAGPLFNPEVDLFDTAKPQKAPELTRAEAFIAKSKALRAELRARPSDLAPMTYTKDATEGPLGKKLEADLAAAPDFDARKAIADDLVLTEGRASRLEHLVVLGKDGELISLVVGKKDGVQFSDETDAAAKTGQIGYTIHNHPSNRGLSSVDLQSLFLGYDPISVVGHSGARHLASATDAAKSLPSGVGVQAYNRTDKRLVFIWNGLLANGQLPFSQDVANAQFHNLLTVAMARLGLINYQGTAQADLASNGVDFDAYFPELHADVAPLLGRAGFAVPPLGNRGSDNGAGTTAAKPDSDGGTGTPAGSADIRNGKGGLPSPGLIDIAPPPARVTFPTTLEQIATKPRPGQGRLTHIYAEFGGMRYYLASVPGMPGAAIGEWLKTFPQEGVRILTTDRADGTSINGDIAELESAIAAAKKKADGKTLPPKPAKPSSGNAAIDGALDDIFGDEPDVQRPGERVERDSGNAGSSDGVGATDVPAAAGSTGRGGAKRAGPRGKRNGQQGAGGGLPAGDAAAVGIAGNQGMGGAERPAGQSATGGNGGSGDGNRTGRLPAGTGGTQDAAGNAAGGTAGVKRDAAARLSAIRDILKEDLLDFIVQPSAAEDADLFTAIDPRKYDALEAVFVEAIDGTDVAAASDKELFRAIILPLKDAGMTRAEVVELTPYLESFLSNLRAGRVNLTGEAPVADHPATQPDRTEMQAKADRIKPVAADEANIRATLPLLLPEQQDDVLKVERRYAKPDGHGMMITNGTGTGKTYSGGGVIKRFVQQGKGNILIVAPSEAVIAGWSRALDALGVPVSQLRDTKDAGQGVVITTYANLRDNNVLAARSFDLIVTDESQNLMSSQSGDATGALRNLRALSNRPAELRHRSRMLHAADWVRFAAMKDGEAKTATHRSLTAREEGEIAKWSQQPRAKVLFLSATPFAYDKCVDYAEGYLFDYPKDGHVGNSRQSGQNLFMVQHFGYRIRYHKLTKPEAAVDSAVFEREFHEKLVRDGVLSGRSLQIDVDYDRKFSLVADGLGSEIDKVLAHLWEGGSLPDKTLADGYRTLHSAVMKKFNYLKRMQLLEAIKAKAAVEDIRKHLAMGRKVVVFHDYNVGGGFNPFSDITPIDDANAIKAAADLLRAFPDLHKMDFSSYGPPVDTLLAAFPQAARAFNGTVPQKKRLKNLTDFNTDGSGADVLIVQADAGGAGISMHDITGIYQRVLINLGMPTKPTTTLQEEGRILRVGTLTNAAFRYYTIGTSWERTAFATRIAERSGTVENLALGNQARDLLNAFIDAYIEAEPLEPSASDGTGGKDRDRTANVTSPYDKAKTHYFGRTKTTGRRDQRDGLDFYPTPEPLAFKMVEWAGIRPNERVLEPSAGDGSIARYTPDYAAVTMVEPSYDLLSTALLRTPHGKEIRGTFENYHLVNKHHVIVMNPPFGSGGKTAYDHLEKAMKHLRPGGRIVALVPTGPSADKRWEALGTGGFSVSTLILPPVTFEKAGTSVRSRIIILDKIQMGADGKVDVEAMRDADSRSAYVDLSNAGTITELFDRLENLSMPRRPEPTQDVLDELEAEGQDATAPMPQPVMAPPLAAKDSAFTLKQTKHSKTGDALFVATIVDRVERDAYTAILAVAKAHGGYYSNFRGNGAIPGFQFKSEADRQAFLDDMKKPTLSEGGDVFGSDDENFAATFMAELAQVDDLFQNPRSTGTTLQAVFKDIVPGVKVIGEVDQPEETADLGADERFLARTAKGTDFYIMQNADEVWIDVSRLSEGEAGSTIYAAVSDYALNTGRVFIGDPAGLSAVAMRRRTDNMLSSALKHGTTRHLAPHPSQLAGDASLGIAPVVWQDGKDTDNVQALIEASVSNILSAIPELARARFDFQTGTFVASDGKPISDGMLRAWSAHPRVREARAGSATLKRGILLNSLARAEVENRPGLLEQALRQQRQPVLMRGGLARTFYQVTPPQMVREAAVATEEIMRLAPALRAELDRLDLGRVKLFVAPKAKGYQGMFEVTGDGAMEITIAASMDPLKTLHHEVIHALRSMNLFTPAEWRALELAAEKGWLEKHDIAARYPDLLPSEQIEEAIAEEFSEALEAKRAPKGSALVTAFNKIARLFRAIRNVFSGAGFNTAEDIFGQILAGEISRRQAGNTGAILAMGQRPSMSEQRPRAVRPLTAQARAHRNSGMGGALFLPDRRIWEELTRAGQPIWARLRGGMAGVSDAIDRARIHVQDRFLPILRAQEAIERAIGKPLPIDQNAYFKDTTFSGKVGNHLRAIAEDYQKPIITLIAKSKGLTVDSVGEWLYARHAIERNAYIGSINHAMPDGGSGMMDAEAQQILADAAAGPHAAALNQIGTLLDQLRDKMLTLREDSGLITHDEARLWRSMYKHYVPLKGFAETDHAEAVLDVSGVGRRYNVRGSESRRALGRQSEAFNPLQAALTQAQEVAIRAEKNRVGQSLYELAKSYPSKALWEVKTPKQRQYYNRSTGMVETRVEDPLSMILEPNEMAVKVGGQERRIIFHDDRVAQAAASVGADQLVWIMRVLSLASRLWSMMRTMYNPEFLITNAFRDFQTAQFNIQAFGEGDKGAIAYAMARDWRKALAGAWRAQGNKFDTEWSKHYAEFQKAGAQISFWTMDQPEAAKANLERQVMLHSGPLAVRAFKRLTSPSAMLSMQDNPALAMVERANIAVDNAIRLAAFVEARKRGWEVEKAAFLAKELTVNFNRRGEMGATANALYPFFNAAVQGSVRTIKALSTRRVALLAVSVVGLGLLNDLLNAWLSDEDDDGQLFYDKVPEYRNERNIHIVGWGNGERMAAIPTPYGYNVFPYLGQNIGKVLRGVKTKEDAMADVAAAIFGSYSPISGGSPSTLLAPFFADPIIEMGENADWTGTPIYPRFPKEGVPDSENYYDSASEGAKAVARMLNSLTGGDFREAGAIDVSPETIDHLSNFITGSAGAFYGRTADVLAKAYEGKWAEIEMRNVPFARTVVSDVGPWVDRDQFYDAQDAVRDANADVKAYTEAGHPITAEKQALANLYEDLLAANREMKGQGIWNQNKDDALEPRPDDVVMKEFNKKFLVAKGKQVPVH